jgi:hypothetical protein
MDTNVKPARPENRTTPSDAATLNADLTRYRDLRERCAGDLLRQLYRAQLDPVVQEAMRELRYRAARREQPDKILVGQGRESGEGDIYLTPDGFRVQAVTGLSRLAAMVSFKVPEMSLCRPTRAALQEAAGRAGAFFMAPIADFAQEHMPSGKARDLEALRVHSRELYSALKTLLRENAEIREVAGGLVEEIAWHPAPNGGTIRICSSGDGAALVLRMRGFCIEGPPRHFHRIRPTNLMAFDLPADAAALERTVLAACRRDGTFVRLR